MNARQAKGMVVVKERVSYIISVVLALFAVYLILGNLGFAPAVVQAQQCVTMKLESQYGANVDCGKSWIKINEVASGPCTGGYCQPRFTALCIGR